MGAFPDGLAMGAEARKPIEETANLVPEIRGIPPDDAFARGRVCDEGFALPDATISRRAGQVRRKWKCEASSAACERRDRAVRRIRAGK